MTIAAASVLKDGTVATTSGTSTDLVSLGQTLGSQKVFLDDGSEFITQSTVLFETSLPSVQVSAPNGYTQQRSQCVLHMPVILANGNRTVNSLMLKLMVDHELTAAQIQTMLVYGAQFLHGTSFSSFWKNASAA